MASDKTELDELLTGGMAGEFKDYITEFVEFDENDMIVGISQFWKDINTKFDEYANINQYTKTIEEIDQLRDEQNLIGVHLPTSDYYVPSNDDMNIEISSIFNINKFRECFYSKYIFARLENTRFEPIFSRILYEYGELGNTPRNYDNLFVRGRAREVSNEINKCLSSDPELHEFYYKLLYELTCSNYFYDGELFYGVMNMIIVDNPDFINLIILKAKLEHGTLENRIYSKEFRALSHIMPLEAGACPGTDWTEEFTDQDIIDYCHMIVEKHNLSIQFNF